MNKFLQVIMILATLFQIQIQLCVQLVSLDNTQHVSIDTYLRPVSPLIFIIIYHVIFIISDLEDDLVTTTLFCLAKLGTFERTCDG